MPIREGKNREVRRIMEHLGLTVNRLIRDVLRPVHTSAILGRPDRGGEDSGLEGQLGPRLSRQLGVRREIPREERRLAPGRAKPTYLRRKPVEVRPERAEERAPAQAPAHLADGRERGSEGSNS